jgi:hypothetical protein
MDHELHAERGKGIITNKSNTKEHNRESTKLQMQCMYRKHQGLLDMYESECTTKSFLRMIIMRKLQVTYHDIVLMRAKIRVYLVFVLRLLDPTLA